MSRGIFTSACPTAAELNDCFDPPRCRVYNNANISVGFIGNTLLTFNSEFFDVGGMHSTSTNTGRITIPTGGAGTYLIQASALWAANASGYRELWIEQNGFRIVKNRNLVTAAGSATGTMVHCLAQCQEGDILECYAYQITSPLVTLNILADGEHSPTFSATWLAVN